MIVGSDVDGAPSGLVQPVVLLVEGCVDNGVGGRGGFSAQFFVQGNVVTVTFQTFLDNRPSFSDDLPRLIRDLNSPFITGCLADLEDDLPQDSVLN